MPVYSVLRTNTAVGVRPMAVVSLDSIAERVVNPWKIHTGKRRGSPVTHVSISIRPWGRDQSCKVVRWMALRMRSPNSPGDHRFNQQRCTFQWMESLRNCLGLQYRAMVAENADRYLGTSVISP